MNYELTFGERLDDLMKEKKIDGKRLFEITGIPTSTISEMVNNRRKNPTAKNIIKLSKALSVSSDYLLGLSDSKLSDINDRGIHEKIGLSDKAIKNLSFIKEHIQYKEKHYDNPDTEKIFNSSDMIFLDKSDSYKNKLLLDTINFLLENDLSTDIEDTNFILSIAQYLFVDYKIGKNNNQIYALKDDNNFTPFFLSSDDMVQIILLKISSQLQKWKTNIKLENKEVN